ncbi:phosphate ABC transporter substrate-binding protein, PhoT family [Magnetococcus marinus MC-1]|uniref:Phosphate ABC transporter substrate-binding protein, PhoT family n=1 Tax=Magnetococcus marinus (strain ATCC BAA-1437 / JCM 17883 / MC-1) TaxID=156889 RepID=A0L9E9_MAGMM|nr:substrate-binding domain-containing protein [Magnetococcus marinus]ABK44592.1 phosphate ABC transporter substrate-binding protein, PhoT family [Magnetococcus marinus MC-1]
MPYPLSQIPILTLILSALLWTNPSLADTPAPSNAPFCQADPYQSDAHGIVGPSFSDPDFRVAKSPEWQQQPIHYGEWAKGADLAITLDQHLYAALTPMVAQFAKQHGIEIAMKEGTCGVSQGLLNRKRVDMAGFCCPPANTDRLPGLIFHTLSISALAVIVSPSNPLANLSQQQVRDIFQGHLSHWDQVEGFQPGTLQNLAIWPVGRLHCTIRPGHWRRILAHENLFSPRLDEAGTIPEMIRKVGSYPNAIGYEVLWDIKQFSGTKYPVKILNIDTLQPDDDQALLEGRYPFYRTHSIAIWQKQPNPHAVALLEYLKSQLNKIPSLYHLIPAARLRQYGWQFRGDELIGAPQ